MKTHALSLAIAFFTCLFTAQQSLAKDPVFAVPVSVPLFAGGDAEKFVVFANFSITNRLWINYLRGDYPKVIFFHVANTPRSLTFITDQGKKYNYTNDEQKKIAVINRTFYQVIKNYLVDYLNLKNQLVLKKGVDKDGIDLKSAKAQLVTTFNRTIILEFADPPYGQSLAQRLVTNRNIDWIVNQADLNGLFSPTRADPRNLVYRYYHNMGHVLGFGHYRATDDQIDIRFINDTVQYQKYVQAIKNTRLLLPPKVRIDDHFFKNYSIAYVNGKATLVPLSSDLFRSVMYANVKDDKKAAGSPTLLDAYVMRYVMAHFFFILDEFIDRFLIDELSPLIWHTLTASRYFLPSVGGV